MGYDDAIDVSPCYSPDDSHMVFISHRNENNPNVWIMAMNTANIPQTQKTEMLIYPNPFSSDIVVELTGKGLSRITLSIIDILGNEVASLARYQQFHKLKKYYWNGTNNSNMQVAPGIYFIFMETNDQIYVEKIIKII